MNKSNKLFTFLHALIITLVIFQTYSSPLIQFTPSENSKQTHYNTISVESSFLLVNFNKTDLLHDFSNQLLNAPLQLFFSEYSSEQIQIENGIVNYISFSNKISRSLIGPLIIFPFHHFW